MALKPHWDTLKLVRDEHGAACKLCGAIGVLTFWSLLSLTKAFKHVMCAAVVRVEALQAVKWLRRKWGRVSARL